MGYCQCPDLGFSCEQRMKRPSSAFLGKILMMPQGCDYGILLVFGERPFPAIETNFCPKWGDLIRTEVGNSRLRIYWHQLPTEAA
jgi:hypothetical protein